LDVALIPSIEYLRDPTYAIVSDACIGCRGAVLSVKLLSRTPMDRIGSLALDEGSRTSAVLAQILLHERYGLQPDLRPLPLGCDPRDCPADATLLIGDRAIHPPDGEFIESWDLGEQWCRWSGRPFVFALWVARAGMPMEGLQSALAAARDAGVAHLEQIADDEAERAGLSRGETLRYLRDNLHFYLGPDERAGLELFYRHAARCDRFVREGEPV
jgi:chorismate dehydratase